MLCAVCAHSDTAEAAQQRTQRRHTVLSCARDPGRGTAEGRLSGRASTRVLSGSTSPIATITGAANLIDTEYGRLDILVNNADISATGFSGAAR
jgi:NAD(P)-dependent dehydrogenase (short-subunit alcohol dehydrogenase family)